LSLSLKIFKITLQRNPNRPRLAKLSTHLDIVTYIRAVNISQAIEIAKDWVKEHDFIDCTVEHSDAKTFRDDIKMFLIGLVEI